MRTIFALALVAALSGLSFAAGTDQESAEVIQLPHPPITAWFANPNQMDWYLMVPPPRSIGVAVITPPNGVDVKAELYGSTSTTPFVTVDSARLNNAPETTYLDNDSMSASPDPEQDGTYVAVAPVKFRSNLFPGQYTIEFHVLDFDAPVARFSNKSSYQAGELFILEASYLNTSQQDGNFEIYLVMEYQGVVYSMPDWAPLPPGGNIFPTTFNIEGRRTGYWPGQPLTFIVPESLAGVGPLNFYTMAIDANNGYESNLAHSPVRFLP